MKKIMVAIAFCIEFFSLQAQYPEFAPQGATWYYDQLQMNGDLVTRKLYSVSEDVLYGKSCKHLNGESVGDFYAYRDSLRMYVSAIADTQWYLLYDFNKNPGDTFYSHVWWISGIDSIPVKVIQKGDTSINGWVLPFMVIESLDPFWLWNGTTILNIGSDDYFIPPHPIADPPISGLRCYEDAVIGSYHVVEHCDTSYTIGIQNASFAGGGMMVTNPFRDFIRITGYNMTISHIQLLDFCGRNIFHKFLFDNASTIEIETSDFNNGLYLLIIRSDTKAFSFTLVKK
jgi:hypothetical protein